MSVVIIGGGLAGLSTAIRMKQVNPHVDVCIIDYPNSNTQIAGMRFRTRGIEIEKYKYQGQSLEELFHKHYSQTLSTPEMELFAYWAPRIVDFWLNEQQQILDPIKKLQYSDNQSWFGPKLFPGQNSGYETLSWFRKQAKASGIIFVKGQVTEVECEEGKINGLYFQDKNNAGLIRADSYIFAGGSPAGSLFQNTTNKNISYSPIELLWRHGVNITGTSSYMFHPFGKINNSGVSVSGCYETDDLASCKIFLGDDSRATEIEEWLQAHDLHNNFYLACQQIYRSGGTTKLVFPDGQIQYAKLALHYANLGVGTDENMISVLGIKNASVIGDAGGMSRYFGENSRLPGTALVACLIDAEICAFNINSEGSSNITIEKTSRQLHPLYDTLASLRRINSHYLTNYHFDGRKEATLKNWGQEILHLGQQNMTTFQELSMALVMGHEAQRENSGIRINRERVLSYSQEFGDQRYPGDALRY